ncbi:class II aldolase/adducin family protein [Dissulfurimicrobium hydrothermale]|uniref:class II aldolase/adducin family protein n=1 Tax=Dissulfurimicrobium hydrothermale TaxID=1750598 RepID=UPI001EDB4CE7|nr:class II aldolase/adducin family protein [Dissulfurimicrobium hydrothermale]UKL14470.1 class II aldolase/adducin family protein [Dissulfurimicrobium hydrothermale]
MSVNIEMAGLRRSMVLVCRLLYQKGLIAGPDGNVSVRLGNGFILITPTGAHKGILSESDLVMVDEKGDPAGDAGKDQGQRPSSEISLHLAIYRKDSGAMAVVHTHAPWTMALSLAGFKFTPHLMVEGMMFLGEVPVVGYAPPGSKLLADAVAGVLDKGPAQILAHHGAITRGPSLMKAFELMECLEHTAKITALARLLGEPVPLADSGG